MKEKKNKLEIPLGAVDWGDLRSQEPVSGKWGFDRGRPIDRYYIEGFMKKNQHHIQGYCIEVLNDNYTRRFGGNKVIKSDVLDIDPNNHKATITGDLTQKGVPTQNTFDCFILTQTLPVIYNVRAAIKNCYAALKPGGVLLITVPALCRYSPHPQDYWRFTDASLTALIKETTDCANLVVEIYGNLVASIGFLIGTASDELTWEELDYFDRRFPVLISASLNRRR
jgi:SAM-dependent methyltransferase